MISLFKIIQSYIDKVNKTDIADFASKQGMQLHPDEISILYFYIKNEYKTLLYGDSTSIFLDLQKKLSPSHYQKIRELFDMYKEKYKYYL